MRHFIFSLIVGIIAGWLSGKIMKGRGFGLLGNLVIGILGSIVGSVIFDAVGLQAFGWVGPIICSTVGAVTLLYGLRIAAGR